MFLRRLPLLLPRLLLMLLLPRLLLMRRAARGSRRRHLFNRHNLPKTVGDESPRAREERCFVVRIRRLR